MRRSSFEIEMDILLILAISPHGITRLMYGSNTSLIRLRIFLKSLLDKGLISEAITNWVKEIGITLIPEAVEFATFDALTRYEKDFDVALAYGAPDIDGASMDFSWSCWSAEGGGYNVPGYCNPEMDDLVWGYWLATNPVEGLESLFQAQELLNNDRPSLTLAVQNDLQAWRTDRFEIPTDSCDLGGVLFNYWALSQIEPK